MAFVRKRGNSHQLIESYREGDQVRQRVIANLGPHSSLEAAAAAEPLKYGDHAAALIGKTDTAGNDLVGQTIRDQAANALAALIPLAKITNSPKKIDAVVDALWKQELHPDVIRAARQVAKTLPALLADLMLAPRGKPVSRAARWTEARQRALDALEELEGIKGDMQAWRENLPDNLADAQTGTTELLDAIEEIDLADAIAAVEAIEEPTFPRGFGRDG